MEVNGRSQKFQAFLYRRLARWITCEVQLLGRHPLALDSKFQTNSLQDVFFHPFYWQLYGWLTSAPRLVVDLGAHCAHFSMLADICFRTQFGEVSPEYILVEPNPPLIEVIARNLNRSGLCPRHSVHQGLVGARSGSATLWVSSKNYLSSSLERGTATRPVRAEYLDLEPLVGDRPIDLLKMDVEGAEYEVIANYPALLRRIRHLMIEIHSESKQKQEQLFEDLSNGGLDLVRPPLKHGGYQLAMFQRK